DILAGLQHQVFHTLDRDAVLVQRNLVAVLVLHGDALVVFRQGDLVPRRRFQDDDLLLVVERQLQLFAADITLVMIVVLRRLRRRPSAAVALAEDDGVAGIVVQESHDDLVVDLRPEVGTAILAGLQRGQAGPDALLPGADQRQPALDAVLAVGIAFQGGDGADLQAAYHRQQAARRKRAKIVRLRKQFRVQSELHVGLPVAAGYAVPNPGDVRLAF